MKKIIKKIVVGGIILGVIIIGCLYTFAIKSEPYKYAKSYILKNDLIAQECGVITKMKLSLFGWFYQYRGPEASANLSIYIIGKKKKGEIYLELKKSVGVWRVEKGNLIIKDGEIIDLESKEKTLKQKGKNGVSP